VGNDEPQDNDDGKSRPGDLIAAPSHEIIDHRQVSISDEGEDLIEGGKVFDIVAREPRFDHGKHRAITAEKLAKWFTGILAGGLLVHYICFMILSFFSAQKDQVEALGQMFHGWFPALTSIVSAAAAYYFAKER
jgi:hypothetical protein